MMTTQGAESPGQGANLSQGRIISQPTMHAFRLVKETRVPGGKPLSHDQNMEISHTHKMEAGIVLQLQRRETNVLITKPSCSLHS